MLVVLSPAKNLDYETAVPSKRGTKLLMLEKATELAETLKKKSPQGIATLMKLSDKLADLNYQRFQEWQWPFPAHSARAAIFAFKGDVYLGLNAYDFDDSDIAFAQDHLRILSGLYGVLRPLDKVMPYRLEMGTSLKHGKHKDLYSYWGTSLSEHLNKQLKKLGSTLLVNLASNEYFKAIDKASLQADIVTPVFKEQKNGQYKVLSFFAKKARGAMSAYIIKNKITNAAQLKAFDWEGYSFNEGLSTDKQWVFARKQP